jgi:predicted 2-oxoglutarate/Fe(II)-dependent dioxygenase YbiX
MRDIEWHNESVFTVEEFLTKEECEKFIAISEDVGFDQATVRSPQGELVYKKLRNNQRVMFDNEEIADSLWEKAIDVVPMEFDGHVAVGMNERLRFYRYDSGQQFNWHQDSTVERDNGELSISPY